MTDPADDVLARVMLAFHGFDLPPAVADRLSRAPAAGVTLLRWLNVRSAGQLRELTDALQRAAAAGRHRAPGPLLVAADQEGGQAIALGDFSTAFPGNMALGATGSPELARRVGRAMGREAVAVGANVLYAPVCDLASNPANPGLGIRSFGADPTAVSTFVDAFVRGVRDSGAAATAKHFPGLGEVGVDTHHALAAVDRSRAELAAAELPPFRAAIEAGAELVMSAHVGVPAVTGDPALPATLSREVMDGLLRADLGFRGVTITDALDMQALPQGTEQVVDAIAAATAGEDLLLLMPDDPMRDRIEAGLVHAARRRLFDRAATAASLGRVAALRRRLGSVPPPALDVVGCDEHRALAREVAERSITLVRDDTSLLPLRLEPGQTILAIMPEPADLTPADTSSGVRPGLADALRRRHPRVAAVVTSQTPSAGELAAIRAKAAEADVIVVGTLAATFRPQQAALVVAVLAAGRPTVTVALRTPWELAAYPDARVHVATYGILPASLGALADALFGVIPFRGHLPVAIPGIAGLGHAAPASR